MSERPEVNRDISDAERRIENVVFCGTIEEVKYDPPRARVRYGEADGDDDRVSNWLPWSTGRAQNDRTWHPPEVGEQVVVVCPSGQLDQGVIMGSVNRNAQPAPGDRETLRRTVYADGAVEEYDREANRYRLDVSEPGGTIELISGTSKIVIKPGHIEIIADRIDLNP
ncbi:MAG: phage baseplate assembly protein V [Pseudomonadota bacterium]